MKKRLTFILLLTTVLSVSLGFFADRETNAQAGRSTAVTTMHIKGEIAKADYGYIIRGKVPAEVFSILNPNPEVLDDFVKSGKIVHISARIVSGDNVEIEKIDGKRYRSAQGPGK